MLRSLLMLFIYVSFAGAAAQAPFIATLGYVWVDTFQPQLVAYIILDQIPVALVMGLVAVGSYIALDRKFPPLSMTVTALQACLAAWATASCLIAVLPADAWAKWDWAFKVLVFSAFVPYAIRSRVQIEAFVQVYVFSLAANVIPFGLKTLISGGGYGVNLGLLQGNGGLAEGGQLSTLCLMIVPLALYLARHNRLVPHWKVVPLGYVGLAVLAVVTALGTYERSALIGLVCLGIFTWIHTKHKAAVGGALIAIGLVIGAVAGAAYTQRIETIGTYQQDSSAYVRVLVWRWTMDYISTHPLGCGFDCYRINHVDVPASAGGEGHTEFGRAFHSSYFEMLGELGVPGFGLFVAIVVVSFARLRKTAKWAAAYPDLTWMTALANALQAGMVVFLTSGAFVGIAFQPMLWYFVALGISLHGYMLRLQKGVEIPQVGWRAVKAAESALPKPGRPAATDGFASPKAGRPVPARPWAR